MEDRTVLITGAAGYIGSYLSSYFDGYGYRVFGCDRVKSRDDEHFQEFIVGNLSYELLQELNFRSFDLIIHLAGSSNVAESISNPQKDFTSLVPPTLDLLLFVKDNCKNAKFIFFSSAAVYGPQVVQPIIESRPHNYVTPYGHHKSISESMVKYYARLYSIDFIICRVFSAFGTGMRKQLFWDACMQYLSSPDDLNFFGNGSERRDFISIDQIAVATKRIADLKNLSIDVVNLGTGVSYSIKESLEILFSECDPSPRLHFRGTPRIGDPDTYCADMTAFHTLIGRVPENSLEKVLPQYLRWFLSLNHDK